MELTTTEFVRLARTRDLLRKRIDLWLAEYSMKCEDDQTEATTEGFFDWIDEHHGKAVR